MSKLSKRIDYIIHPKPRTKRMLQYSLVIFIFTIPAILETHFNYRFNEITHTICGLFIGVFAMRNFIHFGISWIHVRHFDKLSKEDVNPAIVKMEECLCKMNESIGTDDFHRYHFLFDIENRKFTRAMDKRNEHLAYMQGTKKTDWDWDL